jgi:arabinan endo-1,5-alpha-L-arabinosidase
MYENNSRRAADDAKITQRKNWNDKWKMVIPFSICLVASLSHAVSESLAALQRREPQIFTLAGDISPIHDPAIIREGDTYNVFCSNRFAQRLVPMFCSPDLRTWRLCGNVFDKVPDWALQEIPKARGIWAPDISYIRGQFRLYYAVSTFGSNHSVIGLVTNKTLNPNSPDYKWVDQGKVLSSQTEDDWNAIDPNMVAEANGRLWLAFGSFWGGIKMRELNPETGKLKSEDEETYSLANRRPLQPPAIEAPFIVRKEKFYYLFVSFDMCCRGKESNYKIMVGRATKITGPYLDKEGKPMMKGGGTLVIEGNATWKGPGHAAVLLEPKADMLVFHAYDGITGRPALQISSMVWEEGWPRVAALPGSETRPGAQ